MKNAGEHATRELTVSRLNGFEVDTSLRSLELRDSPEAFIQP